MFFSEITGQEPLKKKLVQTVSENRVSHAWLFFGPEGSGALPIALAFARFILCSNRTGTDACGVCPACTKTAKYIHPDLHFAVPVNKTRQSEREGVTTDDFLADWRNFLLKNPYGRLTQWYDFIDMENKQGIISTEESKRLSGKLQLKSYESDYKVAIIWYPEKMNDQAANKLLKLIEEPPPLTIFLLVCENPEQLLTTVRSRCIQVKVPRIDDDSIALKLSQQYGLHKDRATEIARLADGNFLRAAELISEEGEFDYNFNKFRDLMRSCFSSDIPGILKQTEELAGLTREKQKSFLEYGLRTIRESLALHFGQREIVFITAGENEFTPKFAPFINGRNAVQVTYELNKAIQDIERNANGRIVLLDMSLKLAGLIRR